MFLIRRLWFGKSGGYVQTTKDRYRSENCEYLFHFLTFLHIELSVSVQFNANWRPLSISFAGLPVKLLPSQLVNISEKTVVFYAAP